MILFQLIWPGRDRGEHGTSRWALPQRREIDSNFSVPKETCSWDNVEHHWSVHYGFWGANEVNVHTWYCYLQASESQKITKRDTKKGKKAKSQAQILKQRHAKFKTFNQWTRSFFYEPWAYLCVMYIFSSMKVRLLLMHKYCK